MTLKEKFEQFAYYSDGNYSMNIQYQREDNAIEIEKIADEFAIGFAEWCDNNYFRMGNTSFWSESTDWDNNKKLTTKELLQIYKKEKGL